MIQKRWVLFLYSLFVLVKGGAAAATEVEVRILPETIYPGQVIWVQVDGEENLQSVQGEFSGQKLFFAPEGEGRRWSALAAVGLQTKPGRYLVTCRVTPAPGKSVTGKAAVQVQKKEFPVERITVRKKYVDLSEEDLSRVHREKMMLADLYKPQSPKAMWLQGFTVPVEAERGSPFGLRRFFNGEPRSPHSGADLKAGAGTPVMAPDAGRVVLAGELFFSGNTVILDHGGGLYTLYAHLKDFAVQEGETVVQGEVLGHVGATGRVTGPHLHWGARLNGVRVDPFSLVALPLRPTGVSGDPRDRGKVSPSRGDVPPDSGDESP